MFKSSEKLVRKLELIVVRKDKSHVKASTGLVPALDVHVLMSDHLPSYM